MLPETLLDKFIRCYHKEFCHLVPPRSFQEIFHYQNLVVRVKRVTRSCDLCQKCKSTNRTLIGTLHPIIPVKPVEFVTVD